MVEWAVDSGLAWMKVSHHLFNSRVSDTVLCGRIVWNSVPAFSRGLRYSGENCQPYVCRELWWSHAQNAVLMTVKAYLLQLRAAWFLLGGVWERAVAMVMGKAFPWPLNVGWVSLAAGRGEGRSWRREECLHWPRLRHGLVLVAPKSMCGPDLWGWGGWRAWLQQQPEADAPKLPSKLCWGAWTFNLGPTGECPDLQYVLDRHGSTIVPCVRNCS